MQDYTGTIQNKAGRYFLLTGSGQYVADFQLDNKNPTATVYLENKDAFSDQSEIGILYRRVLTHYNNMLYALDRIAEIDEQRAFQLMHQLGILISDD